ncbi:MAG TPA: hypothetical protein VK420_09125 [Longimicrobium sp.]|nr:hypothetical protein [Longimicrobium sp.]
MTSRSRIPVPPLGRMPVGISLPPGMKSERSRSQSRRAPTGPEITS